MNESLVEKKRKEREKKRRERRRRQQITLAVVVLVVILFFFLFLFFIRSSAFEIKKEKISISGIKNVKKAEVLKALNLPEGATIFTISTRELGKRILQNPWVESVKVGRKFPNGLVIKITERKPLALIAFDDSTFLVDEEGFIIQAVSEDKAPQLPIIHDLDVKPTKPGERIKNNTLDNVLKILSSLPKSIYKKIKVISAPKVERITLYTDAGLEILFGSSKEIEKKVKVLSEILKKEEKLIFVDLRAPENPVVKTVGD
jgi:cell division protein FtsQ